jgi:hypothetical protein
MRPPPCKRCAGAIRKRNGEGSSFRVRNYLIAEARLVRHLAGAHLQLVVAQAHRVQERIPARVILKIG